MDGQYSLSYHRTWKKYSAIGPQSLICNSKTKKLWKPKFFTDATQDACVRPPFVLALLPVTCTSFVRWTFLLLFCYFVTLGVIVLWKCQQELMTPHWVTVKRRKESTCHYPWYRKWSYCRAWSWSVCEASYWRICCENYHYVWHIKKKDTLLKIYSDTGDIKLMKNRKTLHKKKWSYWPCVDSVEWQFIQLSMNIYTFCNSNSNVPDNKMLP